MDPVADRYERVTFELDRKHPEGLTEASLIAPGHPLLHAVIEATVDDLGDSLKRGTIFVDRRSKQSSKPMLMFSVEQRIERSTGDGNTVSHHFDYPLLEQDGSITITVSPPYLDYDSPNKDEVSEIRSIASTDWALENHEKLVRAAAYRDGLQPRMAELKARVEAETARTRSQVAERLLTEINHWDREYNRLLALEQEGTIGRLRAEVALARARQLDKRLNSRLTQLDEATNLVAVPPNLHGSAIVIPSNLLLQKLDTEPRLFAQRTDEVERRAVEAVLAAERALGRDPHEMPRNNPGYDIQSVDPQGRVFYIEVKGRIEGADTFTITTNEVTFAQTQGDRHRLALVRVSGQDSEHDEIRYITGAFDHMEPADTTRSLNEEWLDYWSRGGPPQ